jgi:hypothetical protein
MTYNLFVDKWAFKFIRVQAESEKSHGYAFDGTGLNFSITPQIGAKDENGNDVYESKLDFSASTFSFGEIVPNNLIEPRVAKVLSTNNAEKDHFFKVSAIHRWLSLIEPKQTILSIDLSGFQIVLDRDVLGGLYEYISGSVKEVIKRDQERMKNS